MGMVKISWIIKKQTEPWSSSGAIRLAANFKTAPIMCVDSSTASLTDFTGSELILLRPPVDTAHSQARRPSLSHFYIGKSGKFWVELES